MKRIWFRRKYYGWGWMPVTWEGWVTIFIYILIISLHFWRVDARSHSASDTLIAMIPLTTISTAVLIALSYHFGESPRWQWGGKPVKPPFWRWLKKLKP